MEQQRLPPIVEQYIEKLNEKNSTLFQKENACIILENIIAACTSAVTKFKNNNKMYGTKKRQ